MGVDERAKVVPASGSPPGPAPRLYRQVYDIVAEQIRAGALPHGTRLQESQLAARFGVSRAPTRQALADLEADGLVTKAEGRGYLVSRVSGSKAAGRSEPAAEPVTLSSSASWERIYAEVESEIVARISFGSWRVNEVSLARHYGVSRTVARDVIGRLQQRGILRKDEGARWYAPALTPDHIGELYELRWLLEPTALVKAYPNLPQRLLPFMRGQLETAIADTDAVTGETLDRLEHQMHVQLLAHCRNETLMQAITLHQSLLIAHHFLYRWTPRLFTSEPFLPEHLQIVTLLEAGKVEAAAAALEAHLRDSRERAVARVDVINREFNVEDMPYLMRIG